MTNLLEESTWTGK